MNTYSAINCKDEHLQTVKTSHKKALGAALLLAIGMCVLKFAAGIISGSLALVSDAAHSIADTFSLAAAYFVNALSARKSSSVKTFGYQRAEVLVAFLTGILLMVICVFILLEAFERLKDPHIINADIMLVFAVLGIIINALILKTLHTGHKENINIKSAFFHVMADFLGITSVLISALIIKFTGFAGIDLIASGLIVCVIAFNAFKILKESLNILMEGVPPEVDFFEVAKALNAIEGVNQVHELHIWCINNRFISATAHLTVNTDTQSSDIVQAATTELKEKFSILHSTFQVEKKVIENSSCSGFCCSCGERE